MDSQPEASSPAKPRIASHPLFRTLTALACLALPVIAFAQTQDTDIRPLANQLLKDEIGRNGKAQSFYVETHNPDGTVEYTEDGNTEPGRWFTRRNSVCFTYPSSKMSGGCFRVYQIKNCYYFYSDTIPLTSDEIDRDYWTARAVPMGEQPKCEAGVS